MTKLFHHALQLIANDQAISPIFEIDYKWPRYHHALQLIANDQAISPCFAIDSHWSSYFTMLCKW